MSFGGTPKPLGPEFEELARQKERERDGERASAARAAEAGAGSSGSVIDRIKRMLGMGRERSS